jgi:hypothetical protein
VFRRKNSPFSGFLGAEASRLRIAEGLDFCLLSPLVTGKEACNSPLYISSSFVLKASLVDIVVSCSLFFKCCVPVGSKYFVACRIIVPLKVGGTISLGKCAISIFDYIQIDVQHRSNSACSSCNTALGSSAAEYPCPCRLMLVVRGGLNRPKYPILSLHHDHLTSSYGSYRHPLRTSVVTFI